MFKRGFLDFGYGGYISLQGDWSWKVCRKILATCTGNQLGKFIWWL